MCRFDSENLTTILNVKVEFAPMQFDQIGTERRLYVKFAYR